MAVLHTGRSYADDLTDTDLAYHYPETNRRGRDSMEIEATKRAGELQLPVFVVTHSAIDRRLRDVRRAFVASYDDEAKVFAFVFSDVPLERPPIRGRVRSTGFRTYRREDETIATLRREPFDVDPNEVDRALRAHRATQNALADWLGQHGLTALSSPGGFADFDLAWEDGADLAVAEVKSLTEGNEAGQLRLGLGQVLHYQALLEEGGRPVRAVLVVERQPRENRWAALCARHGVLLIWPDAFDTLLGTIQDGAQTALGPS